MYTLDHLEDNNNYYKSVSERILETLKDNFGDTFKQYYYDDPFDIPSEYLPCIVVEKQKSETDDEAPTGHDRCLSITLVKVVLNKMDDIGKSESEL